MIKLLHAADFHLDSAFSELTAEKAVLRRREQRLALAELVELARDCDLMLLSGDLFDSASVYRDTIDALGELFAAVQVPIFIAPGNHDFVTGGSPYLTEAWGENVHIFTSPTIERVHLDKLGCDVYGAGYVTAEQKPLLADFHVADPTAINLMVLHAALTQGSPYAPVLPEEIASSGLDYLALGHVHTACVRKLGQTTYAYPGCLMGRGFDECGQKGALTVTVDKAHCKAEFLPVAGRKYEILTVEVGDEPLESIRSALPEGCENDCYRVILTGESERFDVQRLQEALSSSFFSLRIDDRTLPKRSLRAAVGEDTLRGEILRNLKAQYDEASEAQRHKLAQAAALLLDLMDGREVPY